MDGAMSPSITRMPNDMFDPGNASAAKTDIVKTNNRSRYCSFHWWYFVMNRASLETPESKDFAFLIPIVNFTLGDVKQ